MPSRCQQVRRCGVLAPWLLMLASCGGWRGGGAGEESPMLPDAEQNRYVPRGGRAPFRLTSECRLTAVLPDASTFTADVSDGPEGHPERSTTTLSVVATAGYAVWTRSFGNSEARCMTIAGSRAVLRIDANFSPGSFCIDGPCYEFDRYLQAFDLTTGASLWRVRLNGLPDFLLAADSESVAVVSDRFLSGPQLQVVNAATGELRWSTTLSDDLLERVDGVAVDQGLVVVKIGDNLGTWDALTGESIRTGPRPVATTEVTFTDADLCSLWVRASVNDPIPENRAAITERYREHGCEALCGADITAFTEADPPVLDPDCSRPVTGTTRPGPVESNGS